MKRQHYALSSGRFQRKHNTLYFVRNVEGNEQKQSLPIEQVGDLHIFGEVDLNTKLLNFFSQHEVSVHIYNYYGYYAGSYWPRKKAISGFTVAHQAQHYLDPGKRQYLALQFVTSAVFHMLRNLRRHKETTANTIASIEEQAKQLPANISIEELMGHEGKIRKEYYQSFNGFLREDFAFAHRSKRPPRDPMNSLLSFGNQLTYTLVLSEIYKTALDPSVSFLHEPSTKRFSLSLDLAEIFKPLLVDPIIFSLVNRNTLGKKHFDYFEGEVCYLNNTGKKTFLSAWDKRLKTTVKHRTLKRQTSYRYLIRLECFKLIKHCIGDEDYRPLKAWW